MKNISRPKNNANSNILKLVRIPYETSCCKVCLKNASLSSFRLKTAKIISMILSLRNIANSKCFFKCKY